MLNVINEFTRECLAIRVSRKLDATNVVEVLSDLFLLRGVPGHIRSDNGPEFVAKSESFNSKLWDELLSGEIFYSLKEARVIAKGWRCHNKTIRPHSSLAYRPPSPETLVGQVHKPDQLRRPPQLSHLGRRCTNIDNGPTRWGLINTALTRYFLLTKRLSLGERQASLRSCKRLLTHDEERP